MQIVKKKTIALLFFLQSPVISQTRNNGIGLYFKKPFFNPVFVVVWESMRI